MRRAEVYFPSICTVPHGHVTISHSTRIEAMMGEVEDAIRQLMADAAKRRRRQEERDWQKMRLREQEQRAREKLLRTIVDSILTDAIPDILKSLSTSKAELWQFLEYKPKPRFRAQGMLGYRAVPAPEAQAIGCWTVQTLSSCGLQEEAFLIRSDAKIGCFVTGGVQVWEPDADDYKGLLFFCHVMRGSWPRQINAVLAKFKLDKDLEFELRVPDDRRERRYEYYSVYRW